MLKIHYVLKNPLNYVELEKIIELISKEIEIKRDFVIRLPFKLYKEIDTTSTSYTYATGTYIGGFGGFSTPQTTSNVPANNKTLNYTSNHGYCTIKPDYVNKIEFDIGSEKIIITDKVEDFKNDIKEVLN